MFISMSFVTIYGKIVSSKKIKKYNKSHSFFNFNNYPILFVNFFNGSFCSIHMLMSIYVTTSYLLFLIVEF